MALFQYCWSATVKLALPLLVVVAIAAATPSISAAELENDNGALASIAETAPAGRGRFSASHAGRRLLQLKSCGFIQTCKELFPLAISNPQCCTVLGLPVCMDINVNPLACGSCTTKCSLGQVCCSGTCVNLLTNAKNCGFCGNKCAASAGYECTFGLCGYGF